jgi:uncharacterized protein (DUF1499 family)
MGFFESKGQTGFHGKIQHLYWFFIVLQILLTSCAHGGNMFSAPLINDITTTYPNPPQFRKIAELRSKIDYVYPAHFYVQQANFYKDLKPLTVSVGPDHGFKLVQELARKQPRWQIVSADSGSRTLEATATTALLRFKDDIVIEVRPGSNADQCEVHMRSKSRLGKGDLGANAARIQAFFKDVKAIN